jgi:hypothetical protein
MKDSSIAASLRESVAFNDIARWTKIFVKWGSVRYHHQSQATRYEELKIKLYLSYHILTILDPCLISHQHKSKKHEDLKISVIYFSSLSESRSYLILSFQNSLSSLAYIFIFGCPKIMDKFWTIVDFNIFL